MPRACGYAAATRGLAARTLGGFGLSPRVGMANPRVGAMHPWVLAVNPRVHAISPRVGGVNTRGFGRQPKGWQASPRVAVTTRGFLPRTLGSVPRAGGFRAVCRADSVLTPLIRRRQFRQAHDFPGNGVGRKRSVQLIDRVAPLLKTMPGKEQPVRQIYYLSASCSLTRMALN